MAETLHVVTTYVLPSGIGQRQVADGHITARITLGHIWAPGGVLAEMNGEMEGTHFESGSHPVPWIDRKTRDQAAEEVSRHPGVKPELQEKLATHIRKSAYYEDPAQ